MRCLLLAALVPLAVPGTAAGAATRGFPVTGFTGVTLSASDDVEVRVGGAFSVRAEGDATALEALRIIREGDVLRVSRRSGSSSGRARVYVTMPAITAAAIGGSGDMTVDRVRGATFAARVVGSGGLRLGSVVVDDLSLASTGSGDIAAVGTARRLQVAATGSGDIDAAGLTAAQAEVRLAGSGDVRATVKGAARVRASGSGDVELGGQAQCSVARSGSGSVRCGG